MLLGGLGRAVSAPLYVIFYLKGGEVFHLIFRVEFTGLTCLGYERTWYEKAKMTFSPPLLVKTRRPQRALGTERMKINLICLLYCVAECCLPQSTGQTEGNGECTALPTLRKCSDGIWRRRARRYISSGLKALVMSLFFQAWLEKMLDAAHIHGNQGHS